MLSREDILKADDIKIVEVQVPEWGGSVYVRTLMGSERDKFEMSMIEQRGKNQVVNMTNARAKLVAMSACTKDGTLLFSGEDVRALGDKSGAALQRIFLVSQKLSGLNDQDVKELTKGLKDSPLEGSPSF